MTLARHYAYPRVVEGDDRRGRIRYCLTVLWPGVAVLNRPGISGGSIS